jgi:hypothetical protein
VIFFGPKHFLAITKTVIKAATKKASSAKDMVELSKSVFEAISLLEIAVTVCYGSKASLTSGVV